MSTRADLLAVGLTNRQVEFWSRQGYLRTDKTNPGTGSHRNFKHGEIAVAKTMLRLVAAGLTLDAAQRVARAESQPFELAPGITITVAAVVLVGA
jgi:DNA-binding transcriptional MerR regulator